MQSQNSAPEHDGVELGTSGIDHCYVGGGVFADDAKDPGVAVESSMEEVKKALRVVSGRGEKRGGDAVELGAI